MEHFPGLRNRQGRFRLGHFLGSLKLLILEYLEVSLSLTKNNRQNTQIHSYIESEIRNDNQWNLKGVAKSHSVHNTAFNGLEGE